MFAARGFCSESDAMFGATGVSSDSDARSTSVSGRPRMSATVATPAASSGTAEVPGASLFTSLGELRSATEAEVSTSRCMASKGRIAGISFADSGEGGAPRVLCNWEGGGVHRLACGAADNACGLGGSGAAGPPPKVSKMRPKFDSRRMATAWPASTSRSRSSIPLARARHRSRSAVISPSSRSTADCALKASANSAFTPPWEPVSALDASTLGWLWTQAWNFARHFFSARSSARFRSARIHSSAWSSAG
mmetsp:Transcript_22510/g.64769  ORF Transcript_22510/g.64769 Transcript_22510/m.64769 type:complete len:250 (-) Transcript_22510:191-940(-)